MFSRRSPVNEEAKLETVPKEQYDQLFQKYQALVDQEKKNSPVVKSESAKVAGQAVRPEMSEQTLVDPSDVVNDLAKVLPNQNSNSTDTVDMNQKLPPVPSSFGVETLNQTDDVDQQIAKLREANDLVKVNKFENALQILKSLEQSQEKQIRVRARFMIGELLFNQGEFDLAHQVFEDIVSKDAFSGLVIKALARLVVCSEKLKLPEKGQKYFSYLHDVFGESGEMKIDATEPETKEEVQPDESSNKG